MNFKINEKVENNVLTIEADCLKKTFLTDKTIILTTKKILDTIEERYSILEILSEPSHIVGNTTRSKIRLSGIWKFKISTSNKEPTIEKPKRKYTRKTKKPEDSIRNRISKLSKKD